VAAQNRKLFPARSAAFEMLLDDRDLLRIKLPIEISA
jgi:hypothetical protein